MQKCRPILIFCLAIFVQQEAIVRAHEVQRLTEAEVTQWVTKLDSPKFLDRKNAAQSLSSAGKEAVAPVKQAAASGSPEAATRAIEVLRNLASSVDPETANAAADALQELVAKKEAKSLNQASATLSDYQREFQGRALEQLGALGADVGANQTQFGVPGEIHVTIGTKWTGKQADLAILSKLPDLKSLSLQGADVGDEAVPVLKSLTSLRSLQILGTFISDEAATDLAQSLPNTNFERRTPFLGVGGPMVGTSGCSISTVMPNSAASAADLRQGDVIVQFAGEKISSFQELQELVAKCKPGDTVAVEIFREEKLLAKEISFGKRR